MKYLKILSILLFLHSCKQAVPLPPIPSDMTSIGRVLDSIHVEDQKYRGGLDAIKEEYGWDSDQMREHWKIINKTDKSNLNVVETILDKYGWLGAENIGSSANSTLFLVVQHSSQEVQEKYLPMMRQAAKEGKASSSSLALLEDRVGLGKGELQIYGSQIGTDQETGEMYVFPLFEPENVNQRRAAVGLRPIEDYVSHWNIEWNVEEYKKKLPRWIEALEQSQR